MLQSVRLVHVYWLTLCIVYSPPYLWRTLLSSTINFPIHKANYTYICIINVHKHTYYTCRWYTCSTTAYKTIIYSLLVAEQDNSRSSEWPQLCDPIPLWLQRRRYSSLAVHWTLSNRIGRLLDLHACRNKNTHFEFEQLLHSSMHCIL